MRLGEKLLLALSRKPEDGDYRTVQDWDMENALSLLCRVYPGFRDRVRGQRILDYGCGAGYQTLALAQAGAEYVLGVDIDESALKSAFKLARQLGLEDRVGFEAGLKSNLRGKFDMVISQNSMEHFVQPKKVLNDMKTSLMGGGRIFITFGPPWLAPYGSHCHFFTRVPWANLLFSEKTVMRVRSRFRDDGATRYSEVEGGMNKMTISGFRRLVDECGMGIEFWSYECVKNLTLFGKLPLIRELLTNRSRANWRHNTIAPSPRESDAPLWQAIDNCYQNRQEWVSPTLLLIVFIAVTNYG